MNTFKIRHQIFSRKVMPVYSFHQPEINTLISIWVVLRKTWLFIVPQNLSLCRKSCQVRFYFCLLIGEGPFMLTLLLFKYPLYFNVLEMVP